MMLLISQERANRVAMRVGIVSSVSFTAGLLCAIALGAIWL